MGARRLDVETNLGEALRAEVERLCHEGERHAAAGERAEALACFIEAWERLPEPREEWDVSPSIYRGLMLVLRQQRELTGGIDLVLSTGARLVSTLAAGARVRAH
jgi:hypothetical protein